MQIFSLCQQLVLGDGVNALPVLILRRHCFAQPCRFVVPTEELHMILHPLGGSAVVTLLLPARTHGEEARPV